MFQVGSRVQTNDSEARSGTVTNIAYVVRFDVIGSSMLMREDELAPVEDLKKTHMPTDIKND